MGTTEKYYMRRVVLLLVEKYGMSKKQAKAHIKGSLFEWQLIHNPDVVERDVEDVAKELYDDFVSASFG